MPGAGYRLSVNGTCHACWLHVHRVAHLRVPKDATDMRMRLDTRRRFETLRYNVAPANCSACSLFVSRPDGHESIRNHPQGLRSPCYASSKILRVPIINLVSTSLTRPRYIGRIVITRSFVHYSFLARHFDAWNLKKKGKN